MSALKLRELFLEQGGSSTTWSKLSALERATEAFGYLAKNVWGPECAGPCLDAGDTTANKAKPPLLETHPSNQTERWPLLQKMQEGGMTMDEREGGTGRARS